MAADSAILAAARAIKSADFVLVAAGAGFSADSGLPVYADVAEHPAYARRSLTYHDLCRPELLVEDPRLFYGFWGDCLARYRSTSCHEGYAILDRWLSQKPDGQTYIYTSNVDGHFRRWPVLRQRLHEIHGCLEEWMCSSSMGFLYDDGERIERSGDFWALHRSACQQRREALRHGTDGPPSAIACETFKEAAPADFAFQVNADSMLAELPDTDADEDAAEHSNATWATRPPRCPCCSGPLRPAVLLFNDLDATLCHWLKDAGDVYQAWEERMEVQAEKHAARVVILELGCGVRVPSVRRECESVLDDTLTRGGDALLVRVNPEFSENDSCPEHTISISDSALHALRLIDEALNDL